MAKRRKPSGPDAESPEAPAEVLGEATEPESNPVELPQSPEPSPLPAEVAPEGPALYSAAMLMDVTLNSERYLTGHTYRVTGNILEHLRSLGALVAAPSIPSRQQEVKVAADGTETYPIIVLKDITLNTEKYLAGRTYEVRKNVLEHLRSLGAVS